MGRSDAAADSSAAGARSSLPRARVDAGAATRRRRTRRGRHDRRANAHQSRRHASGARRVLLHRPSDEGPTGRHGGAHVRRRRLDTRRDVGRGRSGRDGAGGTLARDHVGAPAHLSVRRSLRRDPMESHLSGIPSGGASGATRRSEEQSPATRSTGPGTLYVVSTPIGNMGDFSFRAVDTLKSVDVVLAEDTRHTRHLLDRYEIRTPLAAYHEHNEARMTVQVVARLTAGESFALVSDAGTPLLSDPGARLVRAAADSGIIVRPIPGASALLAALVASGLDAERFTFFGFLTRSGTDRRSALSEITALPHTAVLYESPNRLAATLGELERLGNGERSAAVAREMTKQFEDVRRGTVSELR